VGYAVITSASNPRLKLIRKLEGRRARERLGLFVCEGEDLVAAALDAGLQPADVLVDPERPALADRLPAADEVEPKLLAALSALAHPPRVIAVFRSADLPRLDPGAGPAAGLALWQVGDPGNVGTLLRSAEALGPAFVCLSAGCADPVSQKALRASAGAVFRVPLGRFDEAPRPWLALVPSDGEPLDAVELPERVTLVLGAERQGLPRDVVARCDAVVTIPEAPGAASLNVGVAGSIALHEWRRRWRRTPRGESRR
jgi:TrmH family RNA methyltransferase